MSTPSLIPDKKDKKAEPDRIGLRLYNTIAIFDVYVVSRSSKTAREALINAISSGDIEPTEITATEIRRQESIRSSWLDQPPFIADDVTEAEFEKLRGITTSAAFTRFYEKR